MIVGNARLIDSFLTSRGTGHYSSGERHKGAAVPRVPSLPKVLCGSSRHLTDVHESQAAGLRWYPRCARHVGSSSDAGSTPACRSQQHADERARRLATGIARGRTPEHAGCCISLRAGSGNRHFQSSPSAPPWAHFAGLADGPALSLSLVTA